MGTVWFDEDPYPGPTEFENAYNVEEWIERLRTSLGTTSAAVSTAVGRLVVSANQFGAYAAAAEKALLDEKSFCELFVIYDKLGEWDPLKPLQHRRDGEVRIKDKKVIPARNNTGPRANRKFDHRGRGRF